MVLAAQDSYGQAYDQSSVIERASPLKYCRNGLPMSHKPFGFAARALVLRGSAHQGDATQERVIRSLTSARARVPGFSLLQRQERLREAELKDFMQMTAGFCA